MGESRIHPRWPAQHGSVLMLMPAAVLVLVILAALAVDAAVVFLAQRQLADATAAAANDAAGAAVSDHRFYEQGEVVIDRMEADGVARQAFAVHLPDADPSARLRLTGSPDVVVAGATVCVAADAVVELIFSPALPGLRGEVRVSARSTATAAGNGSPAIPRRPFC